MPFCSQTPKDRGPYINDLNIYHTRCVCFFFTIKHTTVKLFQSRISAGLEIYHEFLWFAILETRSGTTFCLPNLGPKCLQRLPADKTGR